MFCPSVIKKVHNFYFYLQFYRDFIRKAFHGLLLIYGFLQILKVGVNVQEDLAKLQREYGVPSSGWVDIRYLAKQFRPEQRKLGLASIAEEFLPGVKLDKDWRVSASNWEADELSTKQVSTQFHLLISKPGILVIFPETSVNLLSETLSLDVKLSH